MRLTLAFLALIALLVACGPVEKTADTPATHATTAPASPPSPEQLESATYAGLRDEPVTLSGGKWQGEPVAPESAARPEVVLIDTIAPTGDLDGDGAKETVALLSESSGGTGSNSYLAVMKSSGAGVENVATALVGDRVQVVSLGIESGSITGVFVQAGEGDAMCCPSSKVRRSWKLEGGELLEQPIEELGKVSIADLAGTWNLVELPWGSPLPEGVEVTFSFEGNTASGLSGCNSYSGKIEETSPRELKPGLFMGTQKFCEGPAMEVEAAYMKALGKATQYSFVGTRLVISYATEEGGVASMVFARAE